MQTLTFATGNPNKVKEIKAFFSDLPITIQSLLDFPHLPEAPEPYETFEENALNKAQYLHPHTGGLVIADDSGLEVDSLNGRPGVRSKRYSKEGTAEANNSKLLLEMSNVQERGARFRCVLALYDGENQQYIYGNCEGQISQNISGSKGFGYDPIFLPENMDGQSMAEITMEEKNRISHRGRALQALKEWLINNPNAK